MWKDWIPQERKVIERLVDETIENDIDPGIFDHIVSKKPLPSHTEILDQESGE